MAGGHGPFRLTDPAIARFDNWRETYYLRFRWTPATFRVFLTYFVVAPVALYATASYSNARWNWNGALKSEALTVNAKPATEDSE